MGISKGDPIDFKTVRVIVQDILDIIDRFENGETVPKKQAQKLLTRYRMLLSKIWKAVPGARTYSSNIEKQLVPIYDLEIVDMEKQLEKEEEQSKNRT